MIYNQLILLLLSIIMKADKIIINHNSEINKIHKNQALKEIK